MRAALFQGPARPGTKADMLAALAAVAGDAAAQGAALLVLPELFLTGYNIGAAALAAEAEAQDGPSAQAVAAIARQHGLAILYGYPERGAGGKLYNSAMLIGADGTSLAHYRKTHLFGDMERAVFTPGGQAFVLAEVAGVRVGILICYDVEFPELVRGLALRGADLVAVPTALMQPYDFVPRIMVRSRAFENQVFLIYANRCGVEGALTYVGESVIVAPDGTELARAGADEALLVAILDRDAAEGSRRLNTYLKDRMPAMYGEESQV
jgi:predicted amidohydrolase